MTRAIYTDYVKHCMRYYTRYPNHISNNRINILNRQACKKALCKFTQDEQDILTFIYREKDTISDNVYNISKIKKIKQEVVWKLIDELEKEIAKIRGLI